MEHKHRWDYSYPAAASLPPTYVRACTECFEVQEKNDRWTNGQWQKLRVADGVEREHLESKR
jgi:hypothetical protein